MKKRAVFVILALTLLAVLAAPSVTLAARSVPTITSGTAQFLYSNVNEYGNGEYSYRISATFTGRPYAWNYAVNYGGGDRSWPTNFRLTRDELRAGAFARQFSFTHEPLSIHLQLFDRKGKPLGEPFLCAM